MKEEKYYTPELEEFYIGFEYYTATHPVSMEEFSPYVKGEFDHNTFEREFNIDIDSSGEIIKVGVPSSIKVKYLDREDLESLGFKPAPEYSDSAYQNQDDYLLYYDQKDNTLEVFVLFAYAQDQMIFQGTIKNKSELKKLLKQIGIC